jgi:hypothetical protein
MADKLLSDLITDIETEMYQVSGPAVQIYTQALIVSKINDAFITFFDDKNIIWKRFLTSATFTLDGTTGETTTGVTGSFTDYDDILFIYPASSDRPLNKWNLNRNPALITGSQPLMYRYSTTGERLFQVLPLTAEGDVVVIGKRRPSNWPFDDIEEDTVPFDYLAIKYYVCMQMLAEDGANPGAADLMKSKWQARYKELEIKNQREPIALNGITGQVPSQWYDSDV